MTSSGGRKVRIGSLTAADLGRRITVLALQDPGKDWNAPRIDVSGTLAALERVPYARGHVWVRLLPAQVALDRPLPLEWECVVR